MTTQPMTMESALQAITEAISSGKWEERSHNAERFLLTAAKSVMVGNGEMFLRSLEYPDSSCSMLEEWASLNAKKSPKFFKNPSSANLVRRT